MPEQDEVRAWIARRWKGGADAPCDACGKIDWYVTEPVQIPASAPLVGGVLPLVPVICAHCANTRFIHLITMRDLQKQGE